MSREGMPNATLGERDARTSRARPSRPIRPFVQQMFQTDFGFERKSITAGGFSLVAIEPARTSAFPRRVKSRGILVIVAVVISLNLISIFGAEKFDDSNNTGWFVRLGGRVLTGVKAEIHDGRTVSSDPRVFDDGFVKPDISGGADTWNWGYSTSSQISGGQLSLHRTENAPRVGDRSNLGENSLYGGEVIAGFEFTRFRLGTRQARFGLELGYSLASGFDVKDSASVAAHAKRTTSNFDLGGILPPMASSGMAYSGTFDGPGSLINLNPVSSTLAEGDGVSRFDASVASDLYTLKFGPWIEVPLGGALSLGLSVGYCSVYADTDFRFTDSVTYVGGTLPNSVVMGHVQQGRWSPGGYAQLRLDYDLNAHLGAFVGGDVQYNGSQSFTSDAGREVKLKFGGTFGGIIGVAYRF